MYTMKNKKSSYSWITAVIRSVDLSSLKCFKIIILFFFIQMNSLLDVRTFSIVEAFRMITTDSDNNHT